jgi:hypothetical protein
MKPLVVDLASQPSCSVMKGYNKVDLAIKTAIFANGSIGAMDEM